MINKKCQMDIKGMVIKYTLSVLFVALIVTVFYQFGMLGKITPGGGVADLGVTGQGITAAAVAEPNTTERNNQTISEETEEQTENPN
jgi:hypothetical protein